MNRKEKTHSEKTSADSIIVAFDYQYYYFLWKLLSLKTGESVGLEVKDDVHTELEDNKQIYFQIKHTVKTKSNRSPINLTESDPDLWKTLSNWAKIVSDDLDNRAEVVEQLKFINKTSFVLASNKSSAGNNNVLKMILDYQKRTTELCDVKKLFECISFNSTSKKLSEYIGAVLSLVDDVLQEYLMKVFFELDEVDIILKCKDAIKADKIIESKIDYVFSSIDSAIRKDNFIKIRNGEKIQISFDDFYSKYRRHYDLARNGSLLIKKYNATLPDKLQSQTFIDQLIEIKDIAPDDLEEIARITTFKLALQSNLDTWLQQGEITSDEVECYTNDAVEQWRNKHRSITRGIAEEDYNKAGLQVLDSVREKMLTISGQPLNTGLSNGTFYYLSDKPLIGWRKDWEKYIK